MASKEVSVSRRKMLIATALLVFGLAPIATHSQAVGQSKRLVPVDPNAKVDSTVVYIVVHDAVKQRVYTVSLKSNETVWSTVKELDLSARSTDPGWQIWLHRTSGNEGKELVLPVAWNGLGDFGNLDTNWLLQAGDRIYVSPRIPELPRTMRIWAPWKRIFGTP
jgi:hypothetical protein